MRDLHQAVQAPVVSGPTLRAGMYRHLLTQQPQATGHQLQVVGRQLWLKPLLTEKKGRRI